MRRTWQRLVDLETRLKAGRYRAMSVKRRWIAKPGSSKMRPLGIPVLEDKIVQQAVKMILEAIWESDFVDESIGYRRDFYWARTKRNPKTMVVKRRTNRKKFQASVLALKEWIKRARSLKLRELLTALRRKLLGYWNYYGVLGNSMMTSKFQYAVHHLLYKWLNRRSQRRSMTWSGFTRRLPEWKLPPPRVIETYPTKVLHHTPKPV